MRGCERVRRNPVHYCECRGRCVDVREYVGSPFTTASVGAGAGRGCERVRRSPVHYGECRGRCGDVREYVGAPFTTASVGAGAGM